MNEREHILVALEGTLAEDTGPLRDFNEIGRPVPAMVAHVQRWLSEGRTVKIFTARLSVLVDLLLQGSVEPMFMEKTQDKIVKPILAWCKEHVGQELDVTCVKDFMTTEIYDSRAVNVESNTGAISGQSPAGLL